jgi:cellulose synthase operon protein C
VKRWSLVCVALALVASSLPAAAQPRVRPVPPSGTRTKPPPKIKQQVPADAVTKLSARVGVGVARRLLETSGPSADRWRAFERLGAIGTPSALELLSKSLEPGGAAKSSEERLVAVRALARHAKHPDVRLSLVRVLAGVGAATSAESAQLEQLVRETAALALARSGSREAIELLGKSLRQEGPVAQAAAIGLEAHPPREIAPIIEARGAPTLTLVQLLGRLGDQRSFHGLRRIVKRGSPEVRAEAAVALTRLGDFETVAVARHWIEHDPSPALRLAAARILTMARDPGADAAISTLLREAGARSAALELALDAASPGLVAALERQLASHSQDADLILGAIGRAGGSRAAGVLARQLETPSHGATAAYALALCSGDPASDALERALTASSPLVRRNAARAGVLRRAALGDSVSGLEDALERLLKSTLAADRAAGAWGLAALDHDQARKLVQSSDPEVARAAARQAFVPAVAPAAARRLAREADAPTRTALAAGLAVPAAADEVPTSVLLALLDGGDAATPIAARALAARDTQELRPRVELLLASADPLVRASAALGLADSRQPSAIGLLEQSYRFETDPDVRHAVVSALSRRKERTGRRTLTLAAELDGDRRVREAARLALSGHRLSRLGSGTGTLWVALIPNQAGALVSGHAAELSTPGGLVLPLAADPDGAISLAGLPAGPVRLRLAAAGASGKASSEDGER